MIRTTEGTEPKYNRAMESGLVGIGGAFGALARYAVDQLYPSLGAASFPWPTLVINVTGSMILGIVLAWSDARNAPAWIRPLAGVGFCGAFTTFSTVSGQILMLAVAGEMLVAGCYVAASIVAGVLAVVVGEWIVKTIVHD